MKRVNLATMYRSILVFLFTAVQLIVNAQDSGTPTTEKTTTTTTTIWYMQPWAWALGGAVLLIIIIALFRGNSTKEVSKTTVVRDTDPRPL